MRQRDLWPPVSRRGDLSTSHEAEAALNASGKRVTLQRTIYSWLSEYPGNTSHDIARGLGLDHPTVWRRVSDLYNKGLVYPDGKHRDPETNRLCMLWWPSDKRSRS